MRKLVALVLVCLCCLQSVLAAAARVDSCCADACQGPAQCVGMACAACVTQAALPADALRFAAPPTSFAMPTWRSAGTADPIDDVWRPPD